MKKLLLCMGDLEGSPIDLAHPKVQEFLNNLSLFLAEQKKLVLLFGGRKETLAECLIKKLEEHIGSKALTERVQTYIPKRNHEEAEVPEGYVKFGAVIEVGEFPEQRREALVKDSDMILLMGGARGIFEMHRLAMEHARFEIPISFVPGPAVEAFSKIIRRTGFDEKLRRLLSNIGAPATTGADSARATAEVIKLFLSGKIGASQVFLAMPFVDEYKEKKSVEKVVREVCDRFGLSLFVAKDTTANKPLITKILEEIDSSALLVSVLDLSRPNVYLETGYSWGKNKPTILCANKESNTFFDVNAHEQIRWKNLKDFKRQLSARIERLIGERIVIANKR